MSGQTAAAKLKVWMDENNYTCESLAATVRISPHTVEAWIRGRRRPGDAAKARLAKVVGDGIAAAIAFVPTPPARDGYYLNEGQTLVLCALSRAPAAAAVRRTLIEVFMAWRRGAIARPIDHRTRSRVRYAKLRLAEAVGALIDLGIDVEAIDLKVVAAFHRSLTH